MHDCLVILSPIHGMRRVLQDAPLMDTEVNMVHQWQQLHSGQREVSGSSVVPNTEITSVGSLLEGMSAQKAELVALTNALELGKDKMPLLLLMYMGLFIGREAF